MGRLTTYLPKSRTVAYAATGVLAAIGGIASAHLVAGLTNPAASPVLAVGAVVIDLTPTPVKEYAVAQFGTADKPILLASVTLVTLIAAAVAGVLSRRRVWLGVGFIVLLTGLATAAAITRSVAVPSDAIPGVVSAVVGLAILLGLRRTVTRSEPVASSQPVAGGKTIHELPATAYPTSHDGRRQFLIGAAGVTAGAVGAAAFGQKLASADAVPQVTLPAPADAANTFPKGVEGRVRGITPLRTSNAAFYRVDTNLTVPRVNADRWRLEIGGMVDRPMTITYRQLMAMPMIERDITLTCVSNEVGGGYVGAARWQGIRLADLLDRVGVQSGADQLLSTAVDGFRIGTPMEVVRDGRDAMVAVGMNGQPLPAIHGFPARIVTPGLYGFVSATKWLAKLTATTYAREVAYWTERDWATDAPIKMSSRVDTPRPLSTIKAGMTAIGGVAWAQRIGIAEVEVSIDNGPWQTTRLGPDVGVDYWRQWYLPWKAIPGRHALKVRATDRKGALQLSRRAKPFPSGSSGIQEVVVFVE
jgi:DMSO/TMAO reductase YedYZ molybdopterin-dependent catalytic subunit